MFASGNSILQVTLTCLYKFPSTELTVPKNIREYFVKSQRFHKTHGDNVCKPYQFSQSVSQSVQIRQLCITHEGTRTSIAIDQPQQTATNHNEPQRTICKPYSQSVVYYTRGNARQHWNQTTATKHNKPQRTRRITLNAVKRDYSIRRIYRVLRK